jgi:hypothetical protein
MDISHSELDYGTNNSRPELDGMQFRHAVLFNWCVSTLSTDKSRQKSIQG